MTQDSAPLLAMQGICKRYGAVQANRSIDFSVGRGQVVGLLGENGSGKSTLMKVLFGMVRPDSGAILYRGRELDAGSPRAALQAGIAMIHQHFTLVDAMTVTENVLLGGSLGGRWLDVAGAAKAITEVAQRYGFEVDPHARVETLSLGERQRVEILKAILRGAQLLILDEPTSILSPPEIARLLDFLRRFRAEGRSVVFITHKLGEVLEVADHVVVLRDGAVSGQCPVQGATRESLARLMVGRDVAAAERAAPRAHGDVLLQVRDLAVRDASGVQRLRAATFDLRAGEVLALAGIDGNGQQELADALAGMALPTAGRVTLDGRDITVLPAPARIDAGIAYIPADRAGTSLVQAMSIEDNLMLRDVDRSPFSRWGRLSLAARRGHALQRMRDFDVRAGGPALAARTLSGGNQQKVALAREIGRHPRVLIAFQPTWGLDPGATRFVMDSILAMRDRGGAVLYISSELEEVLAVGDRIGVLSGGRVVDLVDRAEASLERIGLAMGGARQPEGAAA
jgi:ABC-type uncharacterized transport system ATPase subunit